MNGVEFGGSAGTVGVVAGFGSNRVPQSLGVLCQFLHGKTCRVYEAWTYTPLGMKSVQVTSGLSSDVFYFIPVEIMHGSSGLSCLYSCAGYQTCIFYYQDTDGRGPPIYCKFTQNRHVLYSLKMLFMVKLPSIVQNRDLQSFGSILDWLSSSFR